MQIMFLQENIKDPFHNTFPGTASSIHKSNPSMSHFVNRFKQSLYTAFITRNNTVAGSEITIYSNNWYFSKHKITDLMKLFFVIQISFNYAAE